MRDNIPWADNIKLMGILAVILGHIASPFSLFIYNWHMPLFFMISGFFFKYDLAPRDFIKKDFRRLMIPYFIFAFIGLGVEILKRFLHHRDSLSIVHGLKGILIGMNYEGLQTHYGFVLWFLPTLFFARLIVYFLYRYSRSPILIFAMVLTLFAQSFFVSLPFALDHAMNACLWVFFGYLLFPHYQKKVSVGVGIGLLVISTIYGIFLGFPNLDLANKLYQNVFLNIFTALLIISTMVFILKSIQRASMKKWSSETLLLLVFHPYTNNAAYLIAEKFASGFWLVKFLLSLFFLQGLLFLKIKAKGRGLFQYV